MTDAEFLALAEEALAADPELARAASLRLFREGIEPLSDSFDPQAWELYARRFAPVIERFAAGCGDLVARYRRVREAQPFSGDDPSSVVVLSRVTLGADVAVTSVTLDAVKQRFPTADILFAGSRKAWELFAADPRIGHLALDYGRSSRLADRLAASFELRTALDRAGSIVIDPDSRLTQLGLVPVCAEDRYYFFESRSYGGFGDDPLPVLASHWCREVFGVSGKAFLAPQPSGLDAEITVSLGVGENPAKGSGAEFEAELLRLLAATGASILVDKGASEEEALRVDAAIATSGARPHQIATFQGPFAPFADAICRSKLYVGYDSAGQHVAAAAGTPLITIFGGFVNERMFARWRPWGAGPIHVVRAGHGAMEQVAAAVRELVRCP